MEPTKGPDIGETGAGGADMSLAIVSMLHGAHDRKVVGGRDQIIMCCMTAAISFAIDTGGRGGEEASIGKVQDILDELRTGYSMAVMEGWCTGATKGGFTRGR